MTRIGPTVAETGPLLLAIALLVGCASPLAFKSDQELRRSILESARREIEPSRIAAEPQPLVRQDRIDTLKLSPDVLRQLDEMAGPEFHRTVDVRYGRSLLGPELPPIVHLSLEQAIATGIQNNLNLQFARLTPAISQAQVVAAEAVFDWVLFSSVNWNKTDQGRASPSIGGQAVGVQADERQLVDTAVGIRKPLISGGQFQVQSGLIYSDVETPNLFNEPDPSKEASITLQIDQPLLRGFGSEVTLAQVRLSRNAERDDIESLRAELIRTLTDIETAYWSLYLAQKDLVVLQELLRRGEIVRNTIEARMTIDVKPSQLADAVARVEDRRGEVIRAQAALRNASDQLKLLLNDDELTVGSVSLILPGNDAPEEPIEFSLYDSMITAVENRPEVQRTIISIDNTSIRQDVADNQRMAQLDLRGQIRFNALSGDLGRAYRDLTSGQFIDYLVSLVFEQPIGNRAAEAQFRQRRLERMQATIAYRNTIQGIVAEVKSSLRDVIVNYALIEQTRTFRIAAAENLRTLELEERLIRASTPEFLDLKLRRQESLARAEQQEYRALVDYNVALARLSAATGTSLQRNRINFNVPDVEQAADLLPMFPAYRETVDRPQRGAEGRNGNSAEAGTSP